MSIVLAGFLPVQCQASDATAHFCGIRMPSTPKRSNANAEHSTEMSYCCRVRKNDCSYFITVDGNTARICAEYFACRLRSNRLSRYCDGVRKCTGRAPIEEQSIPADCCTEVLLQKLAKHVARVLVPTLTRHQSILLHVECLLFSKAVIQASPI